jgi:glyoxylase-like metal-dependent hydrolase (beta-lactamase superfamily II)
MTYAGPMQVSERVHAIRIPFKVPLSPTVSLDRFVYCYIISGEKVCLVDTGVAGSEGRIFDHLRDLGHDPSEIGVIVHTHSHPDHIGSTLAMKRKSKCEIMIHDEERSWLEDIETQFAERPVPGFHGLVGGSVAVDRTLKDGDRIDLGGGLTLEVIHTPGHSSGSISLWLREEGVLITGDAVPLVGEMPVYEDARASMRSVERLMDIDGVKVLLGSWDSPRHGSEVSKMLGDALGFLDEIDRKVKDVAAREQNLSSTSLCRMVLDEMGMRQVPTLPLVARSFQSNLRS